MAFWFLLIGAVLALFAAGLLYISFRAAHFPAVQRLARGSRAGRGFCACWASPP